MNATNYSKMDYERIYDKNWRPMKRIHIHTYTHANTHIILFSVVVYLLEPIVQAEKQQEIVKSIHFYSIAGLLSAINMGTHSHTHLHKYIIFSRKYLQYTAVLSKAEYKTIIKIDIDIDIRHLGMYRYKFLTQ